VNFFLKHGKKEKIQKKLKYQKKLFKKPAKQHEKEKIKSK
jgi:hypothetical protein